MIDGLMASYQIRTMNREDVFGAVDLQSACFPPPFPSHHLWSVEHIERHLKVFPLGQFVCLDNGTVIGSASSCIVTEAAWTARGSWNETVGGPFIERHDPAGTTLYGLDISVHPDWRGRGVMRSLYRARFDLASKLGIRYGTAVRIPGYDAYQVQNAGATPEEYVEAVISGQITDRTLTPMLRVGLQSRGVIRNYMEDQESHNAAAVLEWLP